MAAPSQMWNPVLLSKSRRVLLWTTLFPDTILFKLGTLHLHKKVASAGFNIVNVFKLLIGPKTTL